MIKLIFGALLALLVSGQTFGDSNFVSNPYLPYPPACARDLTSNAPDESGADTVTFFDEQIRILESQTGKLLPVRLEVFRTRCSEPNRSLIWLAFSLEESQANKGAGWELPGVSAEPIENFRYVMNLASEPNGWGGGGWVDREQTYLAADPHPLRLPLQPITGARKWIFLLDNTPPASRGWWTGGLSPADYNGAFRLHIQTWTDLIIDVPPTNALFRGPTSRLPLSGRQSGTWVIEGVSDQGFQLAISEQVGEQRGYDPGVPDLPLVIFFSQYTFGQQSQPLWLVGNTEFEAGASVVTIPVLEVSNGEFRGGKAADRNVIGSVTITSKSCNDLSLEYDYSSIGLGTGTRRLQRLFSLETAGYDCRDYEARVAANE